MGTNDSTVTVRMGASGFTGAAHWRERIKLLLRAWRHKSATHEWLATINAMPLLRALAVVRPRLVVKIYRPYLTATLSPAGRAALLRSHYEFIVRHRLGALTLAAAQTGVVLAQTAGKSGALYRLELRAVEPMEREGELVLRLSCGDDLVYSAAFSFFRDGPDMVLGVGCMQGPKGNGGEGLDLIRTATRDLHGLRPKHLLVRLLSAIGHGLGCSAMRLVGNANRAVCRARKQGKVHADYDALWRECGATRRADGDYQLSCEPPAPPDLEEIPSHKRSAARKRHALTGVLAAAVGEVFDVG